MRNGERSHKGTDRGAEHGFGRERHSDSPEQSTEGGARCSKEQFVKSPVAEDGRMRVWRQSFLIKENMAAAVGVRISYPAMSKTTDFSGFTTNSKLVSSLRWHQGLGHSNSDGISCINTRTSAVQTSGLEKIRSPCAQRGDCPLCPQHCYHGGTLLGKIISPNPKGTKSHGLFHKTSTMWKVRPKW